MRYRCENPKCREYRWYGARGIKVCERWKVFENFLEDMGEMPEGLSLDRRDSNGNYEPSNCRWVDKLTQARNKRATQPYSTCRKGHEWKPETTFIRRDGSRYCKICAKAKWSS